MRRRRGIEAHHQRRVARALLTLTTLALLGLAGGADWIEGALAGFDSGTIRASDWIEAIRPSSPAPVPVVAIALTPDVISSTIVAATMIDPRATSTAAQVGSPVSSAVKPAGATGTTVRPVSGAGSGSKPAVPTTSPATPRPTTTSQPGVGPAR